MVQSRIISHSFEKQFFWLLSEVKAIKNISFVAHLNSKLAMAQYSI
jgi:hypothetical protein